MLQRPAPDLCLSRIFFVLFADQSNITSCHEHASSSRHLRTSYIALYLATPQNDAWYKAQECHECLSMVGSTDIERDKHQIEVLIEMQSVLLPRFTLVNNGLAEFSLGFPRSETAS